MKNEFQKYDFRLDEDARWLLENWPPDVKWGYGWFRLGPISRRHIPAQLDEPYPSLIIASKRGNARAELETIKEIADWMSIAIEGSAVSDDDESYVLIADTCEPDLDDVEAREALIDFVRASWLAIKCKLDPGYIALRMMYDGTKIFDELEIDVLPKLWNCPDEWVNVADNNGK